MGAMGYRRFICTYMKVGHPDRAGPRTHLDRLRLTRRGNGRGEHDVDGPAAAEIVHLRDVERRLHRLVRPDGLERRLVQALGRDPEPDPVEGHLRVWPVLIVSKGGPRRDRGSTARI